MQKFPRGVEEVDGHGFNFMNFFQGECSPVDRESTFRYVSEEYDFSYSAVKFVSDYCKDDRN